MRPFEMVVVGVSYSRTSQKKKKKGGVLPHYPALLGSKNVNMRSCTLVYISKLCVGGGDRGLFQPSQSEKNPVYTVTPPIQKEVRHGLML